jgi:hypothetical protein
VPAKNNRIPSELTQFSVAAYCLYQKQPTDTDFNRWMDRFVEKSLSLSDQTCSAFFDRMEASRVEASYQQTNMNIFGTAVTAVLAYTESHARSIFNVATLLTVGNAWFENYKNNYIMTPELNKVHKKIQTNLRDPIAQQIRQKNKERGYGSYDAARADLMQYDRLCSHKVVADIISQSIASADLRPISAGPSAQAVARAESLKQEIYAQAMPGQAGQYTEGEFQALYVVATQYTDATKRIAAASALGDLYGLLKGHLKGLGLDAATPAAGVVAKFELVGQLLNLGSAPSVAKLKAQIDELVTKSAATPAGPPGMPIAVDPAARAREVSTFADQLNATKAPQAAGVSFGYRVVGPRSD